MAYGLVDSPSQATRDPSKTSPTATPVGSFRGEDRASSRHTLTCMSSCALRIRPELDKVPTVCRELRGFRLLTSAYRPIPTDRALPTASFPRPILRACSTTSRLREPDPDRLQTAATPRCLGRGRVLGTYGGPPSTPAQPLRAGNSAAALSHQLASTEGVLTLTTRRQPTKRLTAIMHQMASSIPNGHAPARNP